MKWTLNESTSDKFSKIPSSITRRNPSRFISALIRYSMRKRKLSREGNNKAAWLVASTDRRHCFGGVDSHQSRRILSKEELTAIQIQLAILSDGDGDRPIHIAVANEDLKLVQKLCVLMRKHKISLDITNYLRQFLFIFLQTPLHLAVIVGNLDIIQTLLQIGASPTVCDRNGNTVLHLCVKSHSCEFVLHHLLSHTQVKDVLDSVDYEGYSALHYAVFRHYMNAVKMLKAFGADMDKIDGKSGRTALIHAVLEQNLPMVELLLKCNSSPQKTDYSGRSAYDIAIQIANVPIIQLLENCMPDNQLTAVKEKKPSNHLAKNKRTNN